MTALSLAAQGLYDHFIDDYVRCGYMYSGANGPNEFPAMRAVAGRDVPPVGPGHAEWVDPSDAFAELLAAGLIERRDCQAVTYELPAMKRLELIDQHDLRIKWEAEAPWFYPNHWQFGEIPQVLREVARGAS